jgi:hypothetical protein
MLAKHGKLKQKLSKRRDQEQGRQLKIRWLPGFGKT